jgi:hypothetical protein
MNLNLEANLFLYNGKIGDYYLSGDQKIEITKRTKKRIYLSSGVMVSIKKLNDNSIYLDSKSVKRKNFSYPIIHQVLRDIEGYLIYKLY